MYLAERVNMNTEIKVGYTFIHLYDKDNYVIKHFNSVGIDDIGEHVKEFLLACGFSSKTISEIIRDE